MTPTVFNADIGESIFLEEMNNDHKIECISINHLLSYERSSSTAKKPHIFQCEVKTSSSCRTYNKKKKKRRLAKNSRCDPVACNLELDIKHSPSRIRCVLNLPCLWP